MKEPHHDGRVEILIVQAVHRPVVPPAAPRLRDGAERLTAVSDGTRPHIRPDSPPFDHTVLLQRSEPPRKQALRDQGDAPQKSPK